MQNLCTADEKMSCTVVSKTSSPLNDQPLNGTLDEPQIISKKVVSDEDNNDQLPSHETGGTITSNPPPLLDSLTDDEESKAEAITPKTITLTLKCDSSDGGNVEHKKQPFAMIPGSMRVPTTAGSYHRYVQSYIVCGTNGIKLVTDVLDKWKWQKLADKSSLLFTLKWSDLKHSIDYHNHREGEQMVNHYPNSSLLTTKIGLLESLRHNRSILNHLRLHIDHFFPVTYRMDIPAERDEFFQSFKPNDLWICKPTGANQGKGIFLVKSLNQLQEKLETDGRFRLQSRRPVARIVQRYISNPLLLDDRKFDIRVYLLLVSTNKQLLAFYYPGYIKLSCLSYDKSSSDMAVHLTNQYVQKKHPNYQSVKDDTVWDFDRFQEYLTEHAKLPHDWVNRTLKYQMKRIMLGLHHCVRHRLEQRVGYFELFGLDFMLDVDYNLWLIEVNVNPALHTNCKVLEHLLPGLVEETLGIASEVCSKSRRDRPVFPIEALNTYEKVFPC